MLLQNGKEGVGYYKDVAPESEVDLDELKNSAASVDDGNTFDVEERT